MKPREIRRGIYSVGAVDWDRRLFDALIPLPNGTSYNSYLVVGSAATALFDTVDPTKTHVLLENLRDVERIDYLVLQHAEQDHSGSVGGILERYPEVRMLCSPKAVELLETHVHIPGGLLTAVQDQEELSLGDKTLRFLSTPWVHWPETMSTYVVEDQVLLSCDLFGSHLATSDLFGGEKEVLPAAKRYFAEIMMPFRSAVKKNLDKLAPLHLAAIGPSHGPAYADPAGILAAYRRWAEGAPRNRVVIPYTSMHGSTRAMVDRLVAGLVDRGVGAEQVDLTSADLGHLATLLVDAATLVMGTPTVLTQPHPSVTAALHVVEAIHARPKFLSVVASYGWSSRAIETIKAMTEGLQAEFIEPVLVRGLPRDDDLARVDALAETIAARHADTGLL
jgi:flavorubredoxin